MSVLITGSTGFIGSNVLNALVKNTKEEIIVLKRSFSNCKRIKDSIKNQKVKTYDIDKIELETIFKENHIETIIHIATQYGREENSEIKVLETNLMFPVKLINLGLKYNLKSFINTDSYFHKEGGGSEYDYLTCYILSKENFLAWLKYYSKQINVVNLVLEHPYGAFDGDKKFTEQMIRKIAIENISNIDLTLGEQKRDFIYIKDVVNAYIKALDLIKKNEKQFYNIEIGTGKSISIKEFVETIKKISNSKTELNFGKIPYRKGEILNSKADILTQKDLDWKPVFTLEEGLKEIIEIYKNTPLTPDFS